MDGLCLFFVVVRLFLLLPLFETLADMNTLTVRECSHSFPTLHGGGVCVFKSAVMGNVL